MGTCSVPGALDWGTRIKVKWAKRVNNEGWCQPFFLAVNQVTVMGEVRFLSGGNPDRIFLLNEIFHWKIVFGTIFLIKKFTLFLFSPAERPSRPIMRYGEPSY